MTKTSHHTSSLPPPGGPYAQAVRADGLIALSGQAGIDADGNLAADFSGQALRVLTNLDLALGSAGGSTDDVIMVRIYLTNREDFDQLAEAYEEHFRPHDPPPCSVVIAEPFLPGALIQADMLAVVASERAGRF